MLSGIKRMNQFTAIDVFGGLTFAILGAALFLALSRWFDSRSKAMLYDWAAECRFTIVNFERRHISGTGPFKWWTLIRGESIYFVRGHDKDGRDRSGWVRCGMCPDGPFSKPQSEVRWEDHQITA
jgi:hypothetical protein